MNYILVVDDEIDIREIYEMILRRSFPLDVVLAESGNKAIEIIKEKGKPQIIISDLNMPDGNGVSLHQALIKNNWDIPLVICSSDSVEVLKKKIPGIYGYIEKPKVIDALLKIIDNFISSFENPLKYVPVRISLLLRWGTSGFDLYMKLSETKYVKVLNAGEAFIPSDAERFNSKGLQHLYISAADADIYLENFERNISIVLQSKENNTEMTLIALESLETVERIASSLGWSPAVLHAAKEALKLSIKVAIAEPNILKLFNQQYKDSTSPFSRHVSMLALLSCGFCQQLGWTSESTQMKIGLAALLHDLTLDTSMYGDISIWNNSASDVNNKNSEIIKYRNHPAEAANLLLSMKNIPADVEQIILQHHEKKDGSGFPRGLISSRISPMTCVFIIVEDLIEFLNDCDDLDQKISIYLKNREERYSSGNFKKVFDVLKETVEKSRQKNNLL